MCNASDRNAATPQAEAELMIENAFHFPFSHNFHKKCHFFFVRFFGRSHREWKISDEKDDAVVEKTKHTESVRWQTFTWTPARSQTVDAVLLLATLKRIPSPEQQRVNDNENANASSVQNFAGATGPIHFLWVFFAFEPAHMWRVRRDATANALR